MAAKKKPSKPLGDEHYAQMLQDKIKAGLSLADATEVTNRQRAEDEANGVTLGMASDDNDPPADAPPANEPTA